jgi:PHD/YefM family antitoxin component YafN of YafNO toxin-antitoxin module
MHAAMLSEIGFTEARSRLSELFDQVVNQLKPAIVSRRRDEVVILRRDMLQDSLLAAYRLDVEPVQEPDGSTTMSVDTLGIAVNAETVEAAYAALIRDLREYASDYISRLPLFLNAPNRKHHLPYVLRIVLAQNDAEIERVLRS